jgi:hypothetical protein
MTMVVMINTYMMVTTLLLCVLLTVAIVHCRLHSLLSAMHRSLSSLSLVSSSPARAPASLPAPAALGSAWRLLRPGQLLFIAPSQDSGHPVNVRSASFN